MRAVGQADLIVTTPEKWDGVSRSWQQRSFVRDVALIVIDEIHLLGDERGPVLEVIVSRTNFISSHTNWPVRVVGLSTALANARDLGSWLGIHSAQGMYNFRPSVRPVPLEVHIQVSCDGRLVKFKLLCNCDIRLGLKGMLAKPLLPSIALVG